MVPITFSFSKEDMHPTANVSIKNGSSNKRLDFILMIDTGCHITALSFDSGKVLGFNYKEDELKKYATTASGKGIPYVLRNVDLWIGNRLLKNFKIAWFLEEGDNYLGCDILEYFQVILDKKADKVIFIPYNN